MPHLKACNCPKCGEHFESISAMRRHKKEAHGIAKNTPKPYSWECPICHTFLKSRRDLETHRKDAHGNNDCRRHTSKVWVCKYCQAICNTRRLLFDHYKICVIKQKLPVNRLGYVINYESIQRSTDTIRKRAAAGLYSNHKVSDSTRKKLSDALKKYRASHDAHYKWTCPTDKLSYAEQYFYDIVQEKCGQINWQNNFRVGRYRLDFANINTKVYFEVDGEQHYDEYGIMHDEIRTKWLADRGWFLIARVRWKSFVHLDECQKKNYIDDLLREFISPSSNKLPPLPLHQSQECNNRTQRVTKLKSGDQVQSSEDAKLNNATHQQLLRKNGWINGIGVSNDEWYRRKMLILNCGVDLTKFGWVSKVIKETGLTKHIVESTILHFHSEFEGKYFKRKWNRVANKT